MTGGVIPLLSNAFLGLSAREIKLRTKKIHGRPTLDRDPNPKWHIPELLRGITPESLLEEWTVAFKTPQSNAQTVLHKLIGHLEVIKISIRNTASPW